MKKSLFDTLEKTIQGKILKNNEYLGFYSVDASSYQIIPKSSGNSKKRGRCN